MKNKNLIWDNGNLYAKPVVFNKINFLIIFNFVIQKRIIVEIWNYNYKFMLDFFFLFDIRLQQQIEQQMVISLWLQQKW